MFWDEYLSEKKVKKNGWVKLDIESLPKQEKRFEIKSEDEYKKMKKAVEVYEDEYFDVTYEDFEKIEKCFNEVVDGLKYKDYYFDESYLERIVRVMKYLDWRYWLTDGDVTEEMLLNTLNDLFDNAMRSINKYRSKIMTTSTGGWTIRVDLEAYSVAVSFSLFDDNIQYDDIED